MKMLTKRIICLLLLGALALGLLFGCGGEKQAAAAATGPEWSALAAIRQVPLKHATQFSLTEYEQGYTLLDIPTSGRFLIVPEGAGLGAGRQARGQRRRLQSRRARWAGPTSRPP